MVADLGARLAALSPEKRALLERRLRVEETVSAANRIPRRQDARRPPLSFAQQRLWFLEQLEPGHSLYNLPLVMRFNGPVDVATVERAVNEIIQRHESLRTIFILEDGEPAQEIVPELKLSVEVVDLQSIPADTLEAEASQRAAAVALQPFDLRYGPLIHATILHLGPADHMLVVTMHHIVSDGWSLGVFAREFGAIYGALCNGHAPTLPPLPMQYGDFALWQRDYLRGETLHKLMDYWKQQLHGMPPLLELPTEGARPRVQTFEGGSLIRPYPKQAIDALGRLALPHEATLFMSLLAVFKILLHRFSRITDMVVGSPIANRGRVELEGLIGFFINTLVLRTDLSGNPSFREVLARVRSVTLAAYAHQDLPFERLVEELNPDRNLGHNPLFQVMFGMQNTEVQLPGQNARTQLSAGTSKFDLTLSASQTAEGLTCTFEFNSALFRPETVVSLAEAYGVLIESVVAYPDLAISELPLVSTTTRAHLIEDAATVGPVPAALVVHELFEIQAAATPTAAALSTGKDTYSYAEVDASANRLARALRQLGAGPDSIVGLCMDRTPDLPIAMLAILKAGAAFLPLDPSHPPERLAFMLSDAGVRILLTRSSLRDALPSFAGTVWCLDQEWPRIGGLPPQSIHSGASPDNLAYVIYTSGSTGRPKGVMVAHRGACNVVQTLIEAFHFSAGTRVLQFGSLSFDISIYDLLMVIGCGGTLCLAPLEAVMPGQPLADTLRELRINAITLPPSSLSVVPLTDLPDLHTIVCGGEALSAELAAHWTTPARRVVNAYGPTEATIWSTYHTCAGHEVTLPIGRAISRAQAYVLDEMNEPLPPGFPGELYVGGAGVARGYLNRADLTAERYVPDTFSREPGSRLYRTGDRVVRQQDGEIRFVGRADNQIKLRGYRIELGEIESVLMSHPDVGETAAVIQRSPAGETRIAAYCTVRKNASTDRAGLLRYLRRQVPEHMIPATLRIMDALPVGASGKLDRQKLSGWTEPEPSGVEVAVAGNELEEKVARIFAEVLEIPRVGTRDGFFELGGHSLLATRAVTRLNEAFQIQLPLRDLFEYPHVADLARAVERAQLRGAQAGPPSITRATRRVVAAAVESEPQ